MSTATSNDTDDVPASPREATVHALEARCARVTQELAWAQRRLEVLVQASEVLSSSLDYDATLENVTRLVVPLLGDFGFFDVVEEEGAVRRIARAHQDPRRQAILDATAWVRSVRTDMNLCALSSGETAYHPNTDRAWKERAAPNAETFAAMEELGFTSMISVPLRFQGSLLGSLTLFHGDEGHHSEEDLALAEEIGRRAAAAVWSARQVRALQGERALLDAVLRQMPSGVAVIEAASQRLLLSNAQAREIFRLQERAPDGDAREAGYVGFHPDGRAYDDDEWPLRRSMASGEVVVGEEIELQRGDGSRGFIRVSSGPVRDEQDQVVAALATFDDVTAERRSDDAIRFLAEASKVLASSLDYEATLRALADLAVPRLGDCCCIDIVAPDGCLEFVAASHKDPDKLPLVVESRRLLGRPRLSDETFLTNAVRSGKGALYSVVEPVQLAVDANDDEHARIRQALGHRSALLVPLLARGAPLGVLALTVSDSGRRYDESDLALAEEVASRAALAIDNARLYGAAQQAIAARDEFLSIASHELRTPLAALQLQVDGIRIAGRGQERVEVRKDRVRKLESHTARLGLLVNQLLDVSRLASGRLVLDPAEMDLGALVDTVVGRFTEPAAKAGCPLSVEARALRGRWDASRLDQVITNLLQNALKYGAGEPVDVRLEETPEGARLEVIDRGIGIAEEDQERIFERFERALPAKNYGGLGLGLWIARHLVAAHGGSIRVHSAPGQGARFTVELPREGPPAAR